MEPLTRYEGATLKWSKTGSLPRSFVLRADDVDLGILRWERVFRSIAVGETVNGQWSFKRSGFLAPRVIVRQPGSDVDLAVLRMGWAGGGELERLPSGPYRWSSKSFWRTEWRFANASGTEIVSQRPTLAGLTQSGVVTMAPDASLCPDLDLLVLLGWYVLVLLSDDSAAAVAASG